MQRKLKRSLDLSRDLMTLGNQRHASLVLIFATESLGTVYKRLLRHRTVRYGTVLYRSYFVYSTHRKSTVPYGTVWYDTAAPTPSPRRMAVDYRGRSSRPRPIVCPCGRCHRKRQAPSLCLQRCEHLCPHSSVLVGPTAAATHVMLAPPALVTRILTTGGLQGV